MRCVFNFGEGHNWLKQEEKQCNKKLQKKPWTFVFGANSAASLNCALFFGV